MAAMIKKIFSGNIFVLMIVPLAVFFMFGLHHLTQFETADEHYWIYSNNVETNYWQYDNGRIKQYWDGMLTGNWVKTRINDKPGVTVAWVSGAGIFLRQNLEQRLVSGELAPLSKTVKAEKIFMYFRLPLLMFCGLFSLVFYYLIKKLTQNNWIALFSSTLMLTSPILLGMSQMVNPDALLWIFVLATILSFQIYLNEESKKYAWLAMVFFGLAMLTKYSSVILFPFLFVMILAHFMYHFSDWPQALFAKKIFTYCKAYVLIALGALLLFALLLPDSFVEPRNFFKTTIGFSGMPVTLEFISVLIAVMMADAALNSGNIAQKIFSTVAPFLKKWFGRAICFLLAAGAMVILANAWIPGDMLGLHRLAFDNASKSIFRTSGLLHMHVFLLEYVPLVFSTVPLVLAATIGMWIKSMWKKSEHDQLIFILSLFIVAFYAANIVQQLRLDIRYSIVLYPMVCVLAAIALYDLFSLETKKCAFRIGLFAAVVLFGIISIWRVTPYYFNYTSDLLPEQYAIADGWGYGGYDAAQYLNSMPNASKLSIWSDYNGVCLFFSGTCSANMLTMKTMLANAQKRDEAKPHFDYFVTSRRGMILSANLWEDVKEEYGSKKVFSFDINGRPQNFVAVYANSK